MNTFQVIETSSLLNVESNKYDIDGIESSQVRCTWFTTGYIHRVNWVLSPPTANNVFSNITGFISIYDIHTTCELPGVYIKLI